MFSGKSLQFVLLLSIFAVQCSAPRQTKAPASEPESSVDRMSKIKITDLDGKPVALSDFKGKPVFLNFWATWCGPCVSEMASIEKASQQFKDDIVFLAVSNESPALIKSYLKKNKFSFNFAHLDVSYLDVYVVALPTTLLIDATGEVVEEEEGFRNWASPASLAKLSALVKK
jgi:thiol-disulfide isomerase/thioredoxin